MPIEEGAALDTQCTGEQLEFHALGRRSMTGRFDGGRISTDGGGVLVREADLRIGMTARLSKCFLIAYEPHVLVYA